MITLAATPTKSAYLTFAFQVLEFGGLGEEPLVQATMVVEVTEDDFTYQTLAIQVGHSCLNRLYDLQPDVTIHSELLAEAADTHFTDEHFPQYTSQIGNAWILSVIDRRGAAAA